jgi:hypothetical protein
MLSEYGYQLIPTTTPGAWTQQQYGILYAESGKGTFAMGSSQATIVYLCE